MSAGSDHTCGISATGAAYCWGFSGDDQLGTGTDLGFAETVPTPVIGGLTFASVSASWFHTCGMTIGGVGYCWGDNEFGQLGNGQPTPINEPVRVMAQP